MATPPPASSASSSSSSAPPPAPLPAAVSPTPTPLSVPSSTEAGPVPAATGAVPAPAQAQAQPQWDEETLRAAVHAVQEQEMLLRKAAQTYKIPVNTLRRYVRGQQLGTKMGRPPALSTDEETRLVETLLTRASENNPVAQAELRAMIAQIVSDGRHTPWSDKGPSDRWIYRFLKRHEGRIRMELGKIIAFDPTAHVRQARGRPPKRRAFVLDGADGNTVGNASNNGNGNAPTVAPALRTHAKTGAAAPGSVGTVDATATTPLLVPFVPSAPLTWPNFSVEDSTVGWKEALLESRVLQQELPPLQELANFLKQDLPVKIPVRSETLADLVVLGSRDLVEKLFVEDNNRPSRKFEKEVLQHVLHPVIAGGQSVASWIVTWDMVVRQVFVFLFGAGSTDRDVGDVDPATATIKKDDTDDDEDQAPGAARRPAMSVRLESACVFCGEEAGSAEQITTARDNLRATVSTGSFLDAHSPYFVGYAAGGLRLRLYALYTKGGEEKDVATSFLEEYQLNDASWRLKLLLALLQLSRLFPSLARLSPQGEQAFVADI